MNNKVEILWTELHNSKASGLLKRLFSGEFAIRIYCVYNKQNRSFGIGLSFPKTIKVNLMPFSSLSKLKIEIFEDTSFENSAILCATIDDSDRYDIFSCLCENVINALYRCSSIKEAVKTFVNTLLYWKSLFDISRTKGLSKEEQQGLYGELHFLEMCLKHKPDRLLEILQSYVGCNRALRDFQGKNWALEVKTTASNSRQELTINGERQLDDSLIEKLFLYHCLVDASQNSGESLIDIIHSIRGLIHLNPYLVSLFNSKLFEAGYNDEDENLYRNKYYKIRNDSFYHIHGDFPRICENELRQGVENLTYSITTAQCDSYIVLQSIILNNCTCYD